MNNRKLLATGAAALFALQVAQAHAGFWTGAAVGYLFGKSSNNRQVVQEAGPMLSEDESLYAEYQRNELLMKSAEVPVKEQLGLRNKQIEAELAQHARQSYLDSFRLVLLPLREQVIERQTLPALKVTNGLLPDWVNHWLGPDESVEGPQSFTAQRKSLVYAVTLGKDSPQPIDDFLVTQGGHELSRQGDRYVVDEIEQFGDNTINLDFQDRKHPGLHFSLTDVHQEPDAETLRRGAAPSAWPGGPDAPYLSPAMPSAWPLIKVALYLAGGILVLRVLMFFFYSRKPEEGQS